MGPPQIFGRKIKWQKRKKPCTHVENFSTSSAEKCISSSPAASENLPVLLRKLNLIIFNTFSKIHLELSFGSFVGVVGTVLYYIILYCIII
jgi:hypothetical protein